MNALYMPMADTLRVENIEYRNRINCIFVFRYRTDLVYRYRTQLSYRCRIELAYRCRIEPAYIYSIEIVYRYGVEFDCPSMPITTLISSNELPC